MSFPVGNRKQGFESAPRAQSALGPPGQVVAITVGGAAAVLSMAGGVSQAATSRTTGDDPAQLARNYVTIECDADLAIVFGPTKASVTGANAPVIATVGTVDANGTYTAAAGTAFVLYAKQPRRFLLQSTTDKTAGDLFMGFIGAGAGTMRLYQSSPDNT